MVLTRLQGLRFFKLFDELTIYGNACLNVVDEAELFDGSSRGIDEKAQAEVAFELWQNLDVIDRFVDENPAGMSMGELMTIRQWRDGLTDDFIVWRFPDGKLRFVDEGRAFEVSGLSKEIDSMIDEVPAIVQTTLLPFDGVIVYSEYLSMLPLSFGSGILDALQDMADEISEKGLFVRTADELMRVAPEIRERIIKRETKHMLEDLENEARMAEPGAGQHRGVLAGMTREERKRAIDEEFARDREFDKYSPANILKERCTEGPISADLRDLLTREELPDTGRLVSEIEKTAPEYDNEEANNLVQQVLAEMRSKSAEDYLIEYLTDPESLQNAIAGEGVRGVAGLKSLFEHHGRLRYIESDLQTLADKPPARRGLCYVFYDGGVFDYVMPDEVYETAKSIDWDLVEHMAQWRADLVKYFDNIAELRGIMPYTQAIDAYARFYPDRFEDAQDIHDELFDAVESDECSACFIDDGEEVYLLHYELFWEWCEERGIDWRAAGTVEEGELGSMLKGLLAQQGGKEPRAVTEQMLSFDSLFSWKESQPCCLAMRDFLDAHVPDVRNDYYFADKVLEELIEETKWGLTKDSAQFLFDVLKENDFVPEEHQMQKLLTMWMNMGNALPIWPNNGWAPNELMHKDVGRPVFFNEDGSIKKVGRNDPCPCGSGKKYKKCCGR